MKTSPGKHFVQFLTSPDGEETVLDLTKIVAFQDTDNRCVKILCEGNHAFVVEKDVEKDIFDRLKKLHGEIAL